MVSWYILVDYGSVNIPRHHLGSVVAITDEGSIVSQQRYLPSGQARADAGSITATDFGYTGQRSVDGMGLMDYKARMYDPTIGRFIQPDSVIPAGGASQSLNRYSYVLNSPANASDPSGNEPNWKLRKLRAGYGHYWKQYNKTWHRGGDSALNQAWQWASKGEAQYQAAQKAAAKAADTAAQNAYYAAARGSQAEEFGFTADILGAGKPLFDEAPQALVSEGTGPDWGKIAEGVALLLVVDIPVALVVVGVVSMWEVILPALPEIGITESGWILAAVSTVAYLNVTGINMIVEGAQGK